MDHLLFLPGMLCDGAFWASQIQALEDLVTSSVANYRNADRIEAMAEAVLADAPAQFSIAGHSMGGRVALEVCRRAPGRVQRLGLFATDYRSRINTPGQDRGDISRGNLLAIARDVGMGEVARAWTRQVLPPYRLDDHALVSAVRDMAARHTPGQLAAQIRAGHDRPDFGNLLPKIACSTLVCGGADDRIRPPEVHREMALQIPKARLVILDNCGHMVAMERPTEITVAMRQWLVN